MNIEGNKVIWQKDNIAITDTRKGYIVYKQATVRNADSTAFRFWSEQAVFDDIDSAIEYANNQ